MHSQHSQSATLLEIFQKSEIVHLHNSRSYIKLPITDGIMTPEIYSSIVEYFKNSIDSIDQQGAIILGEEDLGGHLAAIGGFASEMPYALMRRNSHKLIGEINMPFHNLYYEGILHINGLKKGDKVIIIEDIIDTGGTVLAIIHGLQKAGIIILGVIAVCERLEKNGKQKIFDATGIKVQTLITIYTDEKHNTTSYTFTQQ